MFSEKVRKNSSPFQNKKTLLLALEKKSTVKCWCVNGYFFNYRLLLLLMYITSCDNIKSQSNIKNILIFFAVIWGIREFFSGFSKFTVRL